MCIFNFAISFNEIFTVTTGQGAPTSADTHTDTWDISIGELTKTTIELWARWQNTPTYFYIVIGN